MPAPTVAPMTPPITAPMMGDATVARGTAMTLSNGTATMQSTLPTTVGDVAAAQALAPHARLAYVTAAHQAPLGMALSLERRLALLDQARRCGALIIEDDYDSEFRYDGPPLAALQGLSPEVGAPEVSLSDAPVLYLGTFSKSLFPGLRIGFMVVPAALAPALALLLAHAQGHLDLADAAHPPG